MAARLASIECTSSSRCWLPRAAKRKKDVLLDNGLGSKDETVDVIRHHGVDSPDLAEECELGFRLPFGLPWKMP